VHFAVDYLKSPDAYKLGKKVAIVGAGNVAMDAARTAIRKEHCEPPSFIIRERKK